MRIFLVYQGGRSRNQANMEILQFVFNIKACICTITQICDHVMLKLPKVLLRIQ